MECKQSGGLTASGLQSHLCCVDTSSLHHSNNAKEFTGQLEAHDRGGMSREEDVSDVV